MRISFSTAALYPRDSMDALELIARSGLKEAELMPQCMNDMCAAFAVEAAGKLHVSSIHYPLSYFGVLYNAHPGMVKEARELNRRLVESAYGMGTEIIVVHPHLSGTHASHDPERNKQLVRPVLDNLVDLADTAASRRIRIAIENNPKTEGSNPQALIDYVAAFHHSNMSTMVDTTEAYEANVDPCEFIRIAKPTHMHLSDHAGGLKHIDAGEGEMDWTSIFRELKDQSYQGIHVLEPSCRHYLCDEMEALKKMIRTKDFIEQFVCS